MNNAADLDALADLLPEPLLLVDTQGVLQRANSAACRLLGRPSHLLAGRPLQELLMDRPEQASAALTLFARSRSLLPGALTFVGAQGEPLPVRCEGALLRPRSEGAAGVLTLRLSPRAANGSRFLLLTERIEQLSREIARRRAVEAALQDTKEWYRVTLQSIGDAVIVTDAAAGVVFMNPVAEQLTGWRQDEAEGRHLDEVLVIINDASRATVESPVAKVLREGCIVGMANHTLLLRRDGSELPIDDSAAPIRGADASLLGVVLVFRDLSDRYRLERELMNKTIHLEQADRRKDEFLSMLAHELRNPLAPLRNAVYLLDSGYSGQPGLARLAAIMGRQVDHMVRLVDDLLDVARLTRGSVRVDRRAIALRDVVDQAADMVRAQMHSRGLRFTVTAPTPDVRVDGDLTRLVQVLTNLLVNAAKFTPDGGSVRLGCELTPSHALLSVADSGLGIDAALLPRIFDLFVQGDVTLERASSGLGIGLTIARTIVGLHGGTIEARSDGPGLGSEFVVRLPLPA